MRALVATGPGRLELEDVPDPVCQPDQLLVRNHVTAVSSGTEQLMLYGRPSGPDRKHPGWPSIGAFGYLGAGVVIEVGGAVSGFEPGDRVACGRTWGMHREIVDVSAHAATLLPDELSCRDGACAYWAVPPMAGIVAAAPQLDETVAVLGLGPLGLAAVQLLVAGGRRVLAHDPVVARRHHARDLGASLLDPDGTLAGAVTDGLAPQVVLEVSGTQSGLELALELVAPLGRVVLIGVLPPLDDMDLHWPMQTKGIAIVPIARPSSASPEGGGPGSPRSAYLPQVLRLLSAKQLDVGRSCRWVVPAQRAADGFDLLRGAPELIQGLAIGWDDDHVEDTGFDAALREHRSVHG